MSTFTLIVTYRMLYYMRRTHVCVTTGVLLWVYLVNMIMFSFNYLFSICIYVIKYIVITLQTIYVKSTWIQ